MGFESFLWIFGLLIVSMVGVTLLSKQYEKIRSPEAHSDYELRYSAPGNPEQVLRTLAGEDHLEGMYSFFDEDTHTLVVGRTRRMGQKGYHVEIQEKGEHCILTLTLESFTAVGRKVDMDAFMRGKLKAEPIAGKGKKKS